DWAISLTSGQGGQDKASDTVKVTGAIDTYDALFAKFTNSIAAGYHFLVKDTKLLIYRTDGAAFTVATFTADGTALPAATYADGAVLKVSGTPRFMETWSVTLDDSQLSYQVTGAGTTDVIATNLAADIPAATYTKTVVGSEIVV